MGAVCQKCQTIHPSDAAVAVGRFDPDGPRGYRSSLGSFPERATRAEAVEDYCLAIVERHEPIATPCSCGHVALAHHSGSHGTWDDSGCFGNAATYPLNVKCSCPESAPEVIAADAGPLTLFEVAP